MKTSFWVSDPNDLNPLKFWPNNKSTKEENMNSITILFIYISLISSIAFKSFLPLYVGILVVGIIAVIYYFMNSQELYKPVRFPTPNNPFMNVQPTDYDEPQDTEDYYRYDEAVYPTPDTEQVRYEIKDEFTKGIFQDPAGKLFERNNSQREYISQPVGGVPNEQTEFAQWLYGNEYVGKSGSIWMRYGVEHTPDSLVNTGFNASSPTNFGRLSRMEN